MAAAYGLASSTPVHSQDAGERPIIDYRPLNEEYGGGAIWEDEAAAINTITTTFANARRTARIFYPPSVTYLEEATADRCISLVLDDSDQPDCTVRAMLDSGANIFGIARWVVEQQGYEVDSGDCMPLRGASRLPCTTIGRVASQLSVCLCHGTDHAVWLDVPLQVIDTGDSRAWGLLLGTGFLTLIGGNLDFMTSTLTYRPHFIDTPNGSPTTNLPTYTLPLTTTISNPSAAFMRSLVGPADGGAT